MERSLTGTVTMDASVKAGNQSITLTSKVDPAAKAIHVTGTAPEPIEARLIGDAAYIKSDELDGEPKNGHARLHIDVNPTDRDQDDELERLLAAGARPIDIGQPADASWHVLADPEGNEFCLLKRRLDPL
ncbi:VOC family protein [Micromonospora sp. DT4]|uniref:VOC family protein n=1 Tax=Micromonospora sp. DT4 TaxID=3393438 RepID=UPI003CF7250A